MAPGLLQRYNAKRGSKVQNLTPKETIRGVFSKAELPRVPFIPLLFTLAGRLMQISTKEMLSDPTYLANSLQNAQKLFGYDAILNSLDPSLEAEACGCRVEWESDDQLPKVVTHPLEGNEAPKDIDLSDIVRRGRLPVVIEATRRIELVAGKQVGIIGAVTGPVTLARHLRGKGLLQELEGAPEKAKQVISLAGKGIVSVVKSYCELKVDAIMVADELLCKIAPAHLPAMRAVLQPIWNVARFYGAHTILLVPGCSLEQAEQACQLGEDAIVAGAELNMTHLKELASRYDLVFGASISSSMLLGERGQVENTVLKYLETGGRRGFFLTGEGEIPYATPPENIHVITSLVRNYQGGHK